MDITFVRRTFNECFANILLFEINFEWSKFTCYRLVISLTFFKMEEDLIHMQLLSDLCATCLRTEIQIAYLIIR